MWICTRCQVSNEEGQARCIQCGASRTARRFGAGTPVAAPSVTIAAQTARPVPPSAELPPQPRPREEAPMSRPRAVNPDRMEKRIVRCAMGRWLVAFGLILAVLLPSAMGILAVVHNKTLQPILLSSLLPAGSIAPPFLATGLYILSAAAAALLVTLPGLTAAGLGRLLIRLTPPERRLSPK